MWSLRNIYLYLVCFVTLMMMIFGTVSIIGGIVDIVFPTYYSYYPLSFEGRDSISENDKKIMEENMKREEENRKRENKKNLIKSIGSVFVALPIFVYHWRRIEHEKNQSITNINNNN